MLLKGSNMVTKMETTYSVHYSEIGINKCLFISSDKPADDKWITFVRIDMHTQNSHFINKAVLVEHSVNHVKVITLEQAINIHVETINFFGSPITDTNESYFTLDSD